MVIYAILAAYLVFKGKELVSLAYLRPVDERRAAIKDARRWFIAAIVIAVLILMVTFILPLLGIEGI